MRLSFAMKTRCMHIMVLSASLLLGGCVGLKTAYTNADFLIYRYMDDYLDLSVAQEVLIKPELAVVLDDHRRMELPLFVALLDKFTVYAEGGLQLAEVEELLDDVVNLYNATTRRTVDLIAQVLSKVSPGQLHHFVDRINQANEKYHRKRIAQSEKSYKASRARMTLLRIRFWLGPMTGEQIKNMVSLINRLPNTGPVWYPYRVQQQKALVSLMKQQASTEEIENLLVEWWVERKGAPPELQVALDEMRMGVIDMILQTDAMFSADQRHDVIARIKSLRRDFSALLPDKYE